MSLSATDVSSLVETLAQGKHPKVVFTDSAGQIAGKVGKVVRLDEPHDDDFVVVRFGHDELPFTAAEVRLPKRGEFSRKNASKQEVAPSEVVSGPVGPPLLDAADGVSASVRSVEEKKSVSEVAIPAQSESVNTPPPRKKATKSPKAKASTELSVTLAYQDGQWLVSATKGAKVIAKPVPVRATTAVSMVQSLDSPAVSAVVEDIVDQQRQEAADEAERLRQQLAEAEAKLAELS